MKSCFKKDSFNRYLLRSSQCTKYFGLVMSLYTISLQPLITRLHVSSAAKQCWFADDATGSSSLQDVRKWWDELPESGPPLGYFPNAKKCWLIIKPEREQAAREVFRDTAINVTIEGHKHLGAALGSRSFLEEYVGEKVAELLEPLECAVNEVLIQAVTDHTISKVERDLLGFPVRMGGLGFTEPVVTSFLSKRLQSKLLIRS